MASSTSIKSDIEHHGHGRLLTSVILVQTLLVVWLSSWVIGDYLNNQYVRAYVNLTIQADAWMIGTLALVGVVGSSMGLVLRRKRHAAQTLGMTSTQSKIPRPSLATANIPRPSLAIASTKASSTPSPTPISSPNVGVLSGQSLKPSTELHPAVAALKADLSEARMSLGLASVTTNAQRPTGPASPATKFEDQKPIFGTPSTPVQHPILSPAPQQIASHPPQSSMFNRPLPPTVIRPMAPPTAGGTLPPAQTMPTLKIEGGPPSTPRPVGLLPRPEPVQATAKDVSTIITGFMPVQQQQKKKESDSPNGQTNSSQ